MYTAVILLRTKVHMLRLHLAMLKIDGLRLCCIDVGVPLGPWYCMHQLVCIKGRMEAGVAVSKRQQLFREWTPDCPDSTWLATPQYSSAGFWTDMPSVSESALRTACGLLVISPFLWLPPRPPCSRTKHLDGPVDPLRPGVYRFKGPLLLL